MEETCCNERGVGVQQWSVGEKKRGREGRDRDDDITTIAFFFFFPLAVTYLLLCVNGVKIAAAEDIGNH
jgi:hypothetical protein